MGFLVGYELGGDYHTTIAASRLVVCGNELLRQSLGSTFRVKIQFNQRRWRPPLAFVRNAQETLSNYRTSIGPKLWCEKQRTMHVH